MPGDQHVPDQLWVVVGGRGARDERRDRSGEGLGIAAVRHVAGPRHDRQLGVGERLGGKGGVRDRHHRVAVTPDEEHRDVRGEVQPVVARDRLTAYVDHRAQRPEEGLPGGLVPEALPDDGDVLDVVAVEHPEPCQLATQPHDLSPYGWL